MTARRALILGIGGQDGSYLAEHLLSAGYDVFGVYRHSSVDNLTRIQSIRERVTLYRGDLSDADSIKRAVASAAPHEVYNLADQDHIGWSWECSQQSLDITGVAVLRLLEACESCRIFQPVSSTIFGSYPTQQPQYEDCPLNPQSPYAIAKALAFQLCRVWRERYNVWVSTGILYNHDSPRRSPGYLLDDIIQKALTPNKHNMTLPVRDPDAIVDIGFAGDYVRAMHAVLQLPQPGDFIISSGKSYTVREICQQVQKLLGQRFPIVREPPDSSFAQCVGQGTALVGDHLKLRVATGWSPTVDLDKLLTMKLRAGGWL
jgi:GDPmannose 4,6-dehydratase